jgi:TonB family protein
MLKLTTVLAASAVILGATTAPVFAQDSLTLRSGLVADIGSDVDAMSTGNRTEAKIVRSAAVDMPSFEKLANIGGTAQIEIRLDDNGRLTKAVVLASSGRARLDQSALDAVHASTYQAASIDGRGVGGRYIVEVDLDPSFGLQ